jgi:hypothetical protein
MPSFERHPGQRQPPSRPRCPHPGPRQGQKHLERSFRRLLITHGVELPLRNEDIGPYDVDCLWPDAVIDDLLAAFAEARALGRSP